MRTSQILPALGLTVFFMALFSRSAHAYIDPGTGSIVMQAVLAAVVSAGVAVKIFWSKLRFMFTSRFGHTASQGDKSESTASSKKS